MTIEQRLYRLECSNARWRNGCIAAVIALLAFTLIGAEKDDPFENAGDNRKVQEFDVIACHKLLITDDNAKVVGSMSGVEKDFTFHSIFGNNGHVINILTKGDVAEVIAGNDRYRSDVFASDTGASISVDMLDKTVGRLMTSGSGGYVLVKNMDGDSGHLDFHGASKMTAAEAEAALKNQK
jgi:hypothetical protein